MPSPKLVKQLDPSTWRIQAGTILRCEIVDARTFDCAIHDIIGIRGRNERISDKIADIGTISDTINIRGNQVKDGGIEFLIDPRMECKKQPDGSLSCHGY